MVQSANDAAIALAAHVEPRRRGRLRRADEPARRSSSACARRTSSAPTASTWPATSRRRTTSTGSPRSRCASRSIRELALTRDTRISGGRSLHTWNDLLGEFPGSRRREDRATPRARAGARSAAARGPGFTIYATILGSPTRGGRNADLAELLAFGLSRYRLVPGHRRRAHVRDGRASVRARAASRSSPAPAVRASVRLARPLVEQVVAPTVVSLPVREGQRLGEVRVYDRGSLVASSPLVASRSVAPPGTAGKVGWYAKRTLHHLGGLLLVIVTVTMNAAIDRTLTVPELPARPAAPSEPGAHARRRQGDQHRPRAEAASTCPSWRPGSPAGGPACASSRS